MNLNDVTDFGSNTTLIIHLTVVTKRLFVRQVFLIGRLYRASETSRRSERNGQCRPPTSAGSIRRGAPAATRAQASAHRVAVAVADALIAFRSAPSPPNRTRVSAFTPDRVRGLSTRRTSDPPAASEFWTFLTANTRL
ncbi:hypothetical protein EVAR_7512_1 [Eumeta japonica]|uniref:Uncharacterized protein n=1 Tax=Eumeta variegata TaxID=151549 RepID=A0A4C2A4B1_EUMVA|nr:hypothetical protein EVAR_7512_1 [Eumeta japonica]